MDFCLYRRPLQFCFCAADLVNICSFCEKLILTIMIINIHCASVNYAGKMKKAFVLLKRHTSLCCVDWHCWNKGILHHCNISCFSTCFLQLVFQLAYAEWVKICVQLPWNVWELWVKVRNTSVLVLRWLILPFLQGRQVQWNHLDDCVLVVIYLFFLYSLRLVSPFSHLVQTLSASLLFFCPSWVIVTVNIRHWLRGTVMSNEPGNIFMHCPNILMRNEQERVPLMYEGRCRAWKWPAILLRDKSLLPPLPQARLTSTISSLGITQDNMLMLNSYCN